MENVLMYNIRNIKENVFAIEGKYIVKKAKKEILEAEIAFIKRYPYLKTEKIIEYNEKENYIMYEYINGDIIHDLDYVDNCLEEIYKIIQQYSITEINGYGDIYDVKTSWVEFIKEETYNKSKYITKDSNIINIFKEKAIEKIQVLNNFKIEKKVIHGDLGCFNIISRNKQIVGIIDARTIIGDPVYDLIYFIFSNYNIAKKVDFEDVFQILINEGKEKILAYMYILLYNRIAIEEKNNTKSKYDFYMIWKKIEQIETQIL